MQYTITVGYETAEDLVLINEHVSRLVKELEAEKAGRTVQKKPTKAGDAMNGKA